MHMFESFLFSCHILTDILCNGHGPSVKCRDHFVKRRLFIKKRVEIMELDVTDIVA